MILRADPQGLFASTLHATDPSQGDGLPASAAAGQPATVAPAANSSPVGSACAPAREAVMAAPPVVIAATQLPLAPPAPIAAPTPRAPRAAARAIATMSGGAFAARPSSPRIPSGSTAPAPAQPSPPARAAKAPKPASVSADYEGAVAADALAKAQLEASLR
jgi:hypothetical protein